VVLDLPSMLAAGWQSRRRGIRVTHQNPEIGREALAELAQLAGTGAFRPVIDRTYDLDQIVEAHRYVDTGHKVGSVVLRIP
jgi:NADPH:quinone reductase-like Zn-dependent oxidoreductase